MNEIVNDTIDSYFNITLLSAEMFNLFDSYMYCSLHSDTLHSINILIQFAIVRFFRLFSLH